MVSISDQNTEILRQPEGQNTPSATTPTPAKSENNAGIFRVGLTSAQAQAEGLSSLFTKYNADGNDEISQSEFDTYTTETSNQQQQDITSNSGKRVAVGGIYTVQSGDSLSKIAKDFGIPLLDLYNANVDVIGKSVNSTIHPGQQLKISKTQNTQSDVQTQTNQTSNVDKKEKIAKMLKAFGIDVTDEDTQKLFAQFRDLPKDKQHEIMHRVIGQYVDFEKVDHRFDNKNIDEISQMLGIDKQEWESANTSQKGEILANAMNQRFRADLDSENENSAYNKALNRLKEGGATEKEREMYGSKFDFDNLSDEDCQKLAKLSVAQGYVSTVIKLAHDQFDQNNDKDFSVLAQSYMRSIFKSKVDGGNNIENLLVFLGGTRKITNEDIKSLLETYSEVHVSDGTEDSLLQKAAFHAVMENVDEEHIRMLYQNNANEIDVLNEVAKTVAANTTDETRKAMLNNIVENSAEIVQGSQSGSQNSSGAQGANRSYSSQPVSNPIQNAAQISYVSDLRAASQEYQSQRREDNNPIPEQFRAHFTTINEYRDFKGTGMTMAEYQRAKSAIKSNFTSAMNTLVENYANIPDKFKPRILAFFDSMDNNTSGELYLGANDKVRQFMNKYNYMNSQKLLQYVQNHPAELNEAPRTVQQMIRELQEEQSE